MEHFFKSLNVRGCETESKIGELLPDGVGPAKTLPSAAGGCPRGALVPNNKLGQQHAGELSIDAHEAQMNAIYALPPRAADEVRKLDKAAADLK